MRYQFVRAAWILAVVVLTGMAGPVWAGQKITDAAGRTHLLPESVDRIICSGPGCLRLASYLGVQDLVVGVDDIEVRKRQFDARPYALAHPRYRTLPVFGGFRGRDDPEKILGLDPQPQVIFKTYASMGYDPVELEAKTGIPVVILGFGNAGKEWENLFSSLDLMGRVLGREVRARALIDFFQGEISALESRTRDLQKKKTCFVGGVAFKGPHGFQSTEPCYPPFTFVGGINIAGVNLPAGREVSQTLFSKEKILAADPEYLFVDLSTLQMGEGLNGLSELKTDPVYQALTAVRTGKVFGVLPYNWYTRNFGSILADAWYVGTVLYPGRFAGIDPAVEADRIYSFLLGAPVFKDMNRLFRDKAFIRLSLTE